MIKNNKKKINSLNLGSITYIFPVYNEQDRLNNLFRYLDKNVKNKQEVILVNDGSQDNSKNLIKNFIYKKKNFKLISYEKNMGKGYALKKGVIKSKKDWILTLDVDLSANFSQINSWIRKKYISKDKKYSYFGSRTKEGAKIKALFLRQFLGNFFRIFENIIIGSNIKDTQCGFKLYHKSYARKVFKSLKTYGFAHDVEIIFLLKKNKIKIKELPINWVHKSGSKINIMIDSIKMLFDILKIKSKFS